VDVSFNYCGVVLPLASVSGFSKVFSAAGLKSDFHFTHAGFRREQ
jgi:hypothetical protein